jgi:hypothetical protein
MGGSTTFADVLEHTLGAIQPDTPLSGTSPSFRLAPPPSFLFGSRRFHVKSTPYGPRDDRQPSPPSRRLTSREQRALDALVRLGANLRPDFTAPELRTTFRRLARQYHPDGHPASSDAEKTRLSRLFADLNDHHRLLRAVPDSARA